MAARYRLYMAPLPSHDTNRIPVCQFVDDRQRKCECAEREQITDAKHDRRDADASKPNTAAAVTDAMTIPLSVTSPRSCCAHVELQDCADDRPIYAFIERLAFSTSGDDDRSHRVQAVCSADHYGFTNQSKDGLGVIIVHSCGVHVKLSYHLTRELGEQTNISWMMMLLLTLARGVV